MLIKIDNTGKTRSIYECDKCGKRINTSTERRYKIRLNTYKGRSSAEIVIRSYDMCKRCASIINNYIMKKKGDKKEE